VTGVTAAALALALIALAIAAWAFRGFMRAQAAELARSAELQALRGRLGELERQSRPLPGTDRKEKTWELVIGGQAFPIKALPAGEWARAMQDLPDFLFSYAITKTEGRGDLQGPELEKLMSRAQDWIAASHAGEGVRPDLDHLTVPEAMDAIVRISRLNGLDENLAAWFRGRGDPDASASRPNREKVRDQAQPSAGPRPN